MDLDQIRSICAVAKYKNFRKAAEYLNITQPGISRRIKSLENELGVTFFLRTPQSVIMTKQGKDFLPYAERALNILMEGANKTLKGVKEEKLIIAATPNICITFLPDVINKYFQDYNTSINLYTINSQEVYDMLLDQTVDFGFTTNIFPNPLIKYEKIYTDEICCVGHPSLVKHYIQDGNIIKHPIPIIYTNFNTLPWSLINEHLSNNPYYDIVVETQLTPVTLKLAQAGVGFAFLSSSYIHRELMNEELIKVPLADFEIPIRPVYFIFNKDKPKSEKELNFKKVVLDYSLHLNYISED